MNPRKSDLECLDICSVCRHCDWVGRISALGIPSMMDEHRRAGCSESTHLYVPLLPPLCLSFFCLPLGCSTQSSPCLFFSFFPLFCFFYCLSCFSLMPCFCFCSPGFGAGWMSLMGRQAQNLSIQVSIIRRLCFMCPPSCLTQRETHSRYSGIPVINHQSN